MSPGGDHGGGEVVLTVGDRVQSQHDRRDAADPVGGDLTLLLQSQEDVANGLMTSLIYGISFRVIRRG